MSIFADIFGKKSPPPPPPATRGGGGGDYVGKRWVSFMSFIVDKIVFLLWMDRHINAVAIDFLNYFYWL